MRINHILFFLGLLFFAACKNANVPANIIPRDRMVGLLIEVHIIDGGLIAITQAPDSLYKHGMAKYLHLFKNYQTDTTQFKRSVVFYAQQPELFDEMYDEVMKTLNTKVDSLNKVRKAIAKADSAKNVERTKHIADSGFKARQVRERILKQGEAKN